MHRQLRSAINKAGVRVAYEYTDMMYEYQVNVPAPISH